VSALQCLYPLSHADSSAAPDALATVKKAFKGLFNKKKKEKKGEEATPTATEPTTATETTPAAPAPATTSEPTTAAEAPKAAEPAPVDAPTAGADAPKEATESKHLSHSRSVNAACNNIAQQLQSPSQHLLSQPPPPKPLTPSQPPLQQRPSLPPLSQLPQSQPPPSRLPRPRPRPTRHLPPRRQPQRACLPPQVLSTNPFPRLQPHPQSQRQPSWFPPFTTQGKGLLSLVSTGAYIGAKDGERHMFTPPYLYATCPFLSS
jgi:hypothetical protein